MGLGNAYCRFCTDNPSTIRATHASLRFAFCVLPVELDRFRPPEAEGSISVAAGRRRFKKGRRRFKKGTPPIQKGTPPLQNSTQNIPHAELCCNMAVDVLDFDADLLHGVALAEGDRAVFGGLVVDRDRVGRADRIHAAVTAADAVLAVFVVGAEVVLQAVEDVEGDFRQAVLLNERENGDLDRCQCRMQLEDHTGFAIHFFLGVGVGHVREEGAVKADGGFDHVGHVAFLEFGIVVLELFAAEFLVLLEVKIAAAVNAFHFLESEWEFKLDVFGSFGVVGELLVHVVAQARSGQSQGKVPFVTFGLPLIKPFAFGAGAHEKLHFHLFKLPHAEDELPGDDLVAEGFADLGDAKGNLDAGSLVDVEEVDEDALGSFGTQVQVHRVARHSAELCLEHEVELLDLAPVAGAAFGTGDFQVDDELPQVIEIVVFEGLGEAGCDFIDLGLVLDHAGIGLPEHGFVKVFEALGSLFDLLGDFAFELVLDKVLNQNVGTVAFFGVLVVNKGIVECIHVTRSLPDFGVHEDGRIQTHDVFVHLYHGAPPSILDVVFEFDAHRAVIVNGAQAVINFGRWIDEAIFFGVGNDLLENVGVTHGAKIGIRMDLPIKFQGDSLGAITLPLAFGPSFVNLFPGD